MMARRLSNDTRAALNVVLIVLVGVLMVSASTVAILLYDTGQSGGNTDEVQKVVAGDVIQVDYIGQYEIGGNMYVFDTSIWTVASNDGLYPKTPEFTIRGNESAYSPLEFTVASGQMITGFDEGVVGMSVNETRVLTLSPDQAYGDLNPSLLVDVSMVEYQDVFERLTFDEFEDQFEMEPVIGQTITDPFYGWDVVVMNADEGADEVLIQNVPDTSKEYPVFGDPEADDPTGWYIGVSYDGSRIVVRHLLDASDSGLVKGVQGDDTFIVEDIDPTEGEMTFNFNSGVVGKTLTFTVTLVEIVMS